MLPNIDGLETCNSVRNNKNNITILMVAVNDEEENKVLGLEIGADDYLTKPFSPRELVARIQALLRRTNTTKMSLDILEIGDININLDTHMVYFLDEVIELTRKQYELLVYLIKHKNEIISREQLLNAVWDFDFVGDTRMVDIHISHLRDKLEKYSKNPEYIKTVRGFGYKMEDPT